MLSILLNKFSAISQRSFSVPFQPLGQWMSRKIIKLPKELAICLEYDQAKHLLQVYQITTKFGLILPTIEENSKFVTKAGRIII